jgi:HAD superfamily hydrolase (TIGR01549 family)
MVVTKNKGLLAQFDVFIFDWDGTLTQMHFLRKLNQMLNPSWLYKKRKTKQMMKSGDTELRNIVHTKRRYAVEMRAMEFKNRILISMIEISLKFVKPHLQEYVKDVIRTLASSNKKIALLTDANAYRALRELSEEKLSNYFDVVVSGQEINALKPNPGGIDTVLYALNAHKNKEKAVYICDMVDDVLAAKNAGVRACAVANGVESYERLSRAKPWRLFRSMEALREAL